MSVLENAYDLIQTGQLEDAKRLLDTHRTDFEKNPDYWWLLAHATTDAEAGRSALGRVLLLDKDYPGARELDSDVRAVEQTPSQAGIKKQRRWLPVVAGILLLLIAGVILILALNNAATPTPIQIAAVTDVSATQPALGENVTPATDNLLMPVDTFAETATALNKPTIESPQIILSVVLSPEAQLSPAVSEALATSTKSITFETEIPLSDAQVTLEPSATSDQITPFVLSPEVTLSGIPTDISTEVLPTSEAQTVNNITPVPVTYNFMQGQTTPDNGVVIEGETLKISLCALSGIGAGNAIRDLLLTVSTGTEELDPATNIIEIAIVDCNDTDTEQRVVSVPRSQIDKYAEGSITLQQLQQSIQPVR